MDLPGKVVDTMASNMCMCGFRRIPEVHKFVFQHLMIVSCDLLQFIEKLAIVPDISFQVMFLRSSRWGY